MIFLILYSVVDPIMLKAICEKLNNIDWHELGFICDGRFLFSQRSLENAMLDSSFLEFTNDKTINEVKGIKIFKNKNLQNSIKQNIIKCLEFFDYHSINKGQK